MLRRGRQHDPEYGGPQVGIPSLVAFFLVFVGVWVGLNLALGQLISFRPYSEVFNDPRSALLQGMVPMAVASAITLVIAARYGLFRDIWREPPSVPEAPWWMWWAGLLPVAAIIALAVYESTAISHIRVFSLPQVAALLATVAVTGFAQEVHFRGLLLVGARRRFRAEWQAFTLSTALFGALPLFNVLLGSSVPVVLGRAVLAVGIGATLYCVRRTARSLVPAIALHIMLSLVLGLGFS
ncbi:CPBP family glutamic-type intramembrane protease [Allosalinactinospora lopnorensis]|uniref:CPBP family glutamic-type intramembrane protease n=1 Tax=Allosalinactinospora lopnorensis TaxID=1352348 RepID=UPI000623C48E|nr:CPBP family glutamic-type intramembrane protease [Allosalinactinospora lopnorensis]